MQTIYFVRHGETQSNVNRTLAGSRTDSPLTEKGIEQARQLAAKMQELGIELIVASPLARARDTATLIAQEIGYSHEVVLNQLFVERDFGSATGLPYHEAHLALDSNSVSDVEPIAKLAERAQAAIEWLRTQPQQTILVVSHGGFGQMFGAVVAGKDPEQFLTYPHLENAEFYKFEIG